MRDHFKHLHLWLIIPFIITIAGFYNSYWSRFIDSNINHHFHALSATAWYLLLIMQPYYFTRGQMKAHRTFGMIGFLIAGFVAASALGVVRGHITDLDPVLDDFIYQYRYSLSLTDYIYIAGFLLTIIMSVVYRRDTPKHSAWLISSVFWVFSPATDRFTFLVLNPLLNANAEWFDFEAQFWISHLFIISILLVIVILEYRRGMKYLLPYILIAVFHIVNPLLLIGLADSEALANWFEFMYRPPFSE